MRTHPLRFTAFAVALLALGATLVAQGRGPGFGPGCGTAAGQGRDCMGLNLTEAQQVQVKAIRERHQAAITAKGETADAARKAMREAMANAATDAETLQAQHEKVSAAQFDLMLERRAMRQEILPLLTDAQKVQFEKRTAGMGRSGARGKGQGQGQGQGQGRGAGRGFGPGMNPHCPLVKAS